MFIRWRMAGLAFFFAAAIPSTAQVAPQPKSSVQVAARPKGRMEIEEPAGFVDYVVDGNLTLSLDDTIRLALANNTDIRIDHSQIETARDSLQRALAPFDPTAGSSFNTFRQLSPQYTQLGGAPTLSSLTQTTQVGVVQTLETGTNYQVTFNSSKNSTNSSYDFFSPAYVTALSFTFTQPLLRGFGLFVNRAPIIIAQRGLAQSRANFEAEVNDLLLQVVTDYWNVIQARDNLTVQKESLDEAQKSYDRDKHSLELGALPPLDIYRSESQVASRRVSVIQAEYALKQSEDVLRRDLGADIDPNIRALDLDLTEKPAPSGELMTIDIPTAIDKALNYRPEIESTRQQLATDDANIRVAHNGLLPNLSLSGTYQTNGLNEVITNGAVSAGSFGTAMNQMFGFGYPGYGFALSLSYPFRNHQAQANMGDALAAKRRDLYFERQLHQAITLNTTNAVHQLEESKLSMEAAKVALDLAQKTLQAEQHKYELGAETVFFVLEAQTELTQAEQTLLQAQVGYQLATAAVDHATGGLLVRLRVQITNLSH
ncbi:MAG TPA: TolC family protein [Candidatus Acidoferrum sp.]|nr:TolC family protein [Candidatus Acidoferrum sp.]